MTRPTNSARLRNAPAIEAEPADEAAAVSPHWRWRTFPVFAAFVAGLLIASLVNRETDSAFEGAVQIAALVGGSYVLIHLLVTNVIVAGRIRRRQRGSVDEFEDVVVHPDEV